jgi:hypothetical protein
MHKMNTIAATAISQPEFDLTQLLYWVSEREKIRQRREAGEPPPWTDNTIMQEWSCTNVRREDDRVTRWIAKHWREKHADNPHVWFALAVARLVNWVATLAAIGFPVPWSREHFIDVCQHCERAGGTVWSNSYLIPGGPKGMPKREHVADLLDDLWLARSALQPKPGMTLNTWHQMLERRRGLGSFLAGQIVADAKFIEPLASAPDWMTFATSGPGSRKGLNRVLGRPVDAPWDEQEWRAVFHRMRAVATPELEKRSIKDLSASDLQNCLCELDKFERVRLGEGKPKRRFELHEAETLASASSGIAKGGPKDTASPDDFPQPQRRFEPHDTKTPTSASAGTTNSAPKDMAPHGTANSAPPKDTASPDDFPDLSTLRLDQSFAETGGVKKLLTTVPVRKPNPQDWCRVHPALEYRETLALIELKDDREWYLLPPHIARELPGEIVPVVLYTAINRQGVVFLWPVKLPKPDSKQVAWYRSAAEAAELATKRWVRTKANMALGAYEIFEAASALSDPRWPDISFRELLRIGFRDCLVTSFDHPVIKRLLGQS